MQRAVSVLLFDLDGTLLLTGGAGARAMERAGRRIFGDRFSFDGVVVSGGLDPLLFAEAARLSAIADAHLHHEQFQHFYLQALAEELERGRDAVRMLPGIDRLLRRLASEADTTLGLVTGNYRRAAPLKLRAAGVDPAQFQVSAFGDEAPDRPGMVRLAMERHHARTGRVLEPSRYIVVGDTPRDVHCARANGCRCFGVATGRYSTQQLSSAGADVVADSLEDAAPLLELLASR